MKHRVGRVFQYFTTEAKIIDKSVVFFLYLRSRHFFFNVGDLKHCRKMSDTSEELNISVNQG